MSAWAALRPACPAHNFDLQSAFVTSPRTAAFRPVYFAPVERQLKERLIGAAVLVAAAVVLVPEMFSGSASRVTSADATDAIAVDAADSSASSGQLKTYHIQLQDRGEPASSAPMAIESSAASADAPSANTAAASGETSTVDANATAAMTAASAASSSSAKPPVPASSSSQVIPRSVEPKQAQAEPEKKSAAPNSKGWAVQIGSFGTDAKAKQLLSSLKAQDYPAYLGPVTVNGKTLYRVRVGPLAERPAADALLKKLKSAYPDASVVSSAR